MSQLPSAALGPAHQLALPMRPQMPTLADNERAIHQHARYQLATQQADDLIQEWRNLHVGGERSKIWGPPDTSSNILVEVFRQLTTPGLYGRRPQVTHPDRVNLGLVGTNGALEQAGFWTRAMWVQFLTLCLSDLFLRFSVDDRGRLVEQIALPFNLFQVASEDDPSQPRELWELRLFWFADPAGRGGSWRYVWEVFDKGRTLRDGTVAAEPSWRMHLASGLLSPPVGRPHAALGEDVSGRFLRRPDGTLGAQVGQAYPWRTADGEPILPYVHYQDQDTGQLWNTWLRRDVHRGTLNGMLYWSYVGHCARDATGSYVIIAGMWPVGSDVVQTEQRLLEAATHATATTAQAVVKTKVIEPGTTEYHTLEPGVTPLVKEIAPAVNLPAIVDFVFAYERRQLARLGINEDSTTRNSSNPESASALMIKNVGKREFAAQVEPLFRRNDSRSYLVAAVALRIHGIVTYAETGYTTVYARIPKTPDELQEEREEDTWAMEQGFASKIDILKKRNPGMTQEAAIQHLAEVAVEEALVARRTQELMAEAGLLNTEAPGPPVDPPEGGEDVMAQLRRVLAQLEQP